MHLYIIFFFVLTGMMNTCYSKRSKQYCPQIDVVDLSLNDIYCQQPMFLNLVEKSDVFEIIDNICITLFPLPDDPNTFIIYSSRVYCDGSQDIFTSIGTDISTGKSRKASPFFTFTETYFGYAGCDTYLTLHCNEFGSDVSPSIFTSSFSCRPIGLSCLHKIEEIIQESGLPSMEFYALPMKLPNRCITQQACIVPPNPFSLAGYSGVALF